MFQNMDLSLHENHFNTVKWLRNDSLCTVNNEKKILVCIYTIWRRLCKPKCKSHEKREVIYQKPHSQSFSTQYSEAVGETLHCAF